MNKLLNKPENESEMANDDLLWENISELPYFRGFLRAIEGRFYQEQILDSPILDLGCGDGHFSARTFKRFPVLGIDSSIKELQKANRFQFFTNLICCRGGNLPFIQETYASVISNSVLEHISDVDSVIREAYRILKSDGKFFLTVPNNNFSEKLSIAVLFGRLGLPKISGFYQKWFNMISRHYHTDPCEMWEKRLINAGFKVIEKYNYFPPKYLTILEWGHYLGLPSLINKIVFGKWVLWPSPKNFLLRMIYSNLMNFYKLNPISDNGAYSFIIAKK